MTRMTGPDCAAVCNLINIHTKTHTDTVISIIDPSLGGLMRYRIIRIDPREDQ